METVSRLSLLGSLLMGCVCIANGQPTGAPWPMEMQDRWGTGRAPVGPDPSSFTTPWIYRVIATDSRPTHAPVLDAGGVGYYSGTSFGVYRFDYTTGNVLAHFAMGGGAEASVALGNHQLVYARTGSKLLAVLNSMAQSLWNVNIGFVGSPTVGPGGDPIACTNTGVVTRWQGLSGRVVWQTTGYGDVNGPVKFSRDDTVAIVASGNTISALNWADGSETWQRDLGSRSGNVGVAPDGTVVAGSWGAMIFGLDPETGADRWTVPSNSLTRSAPAFDEEGNVYVASREGGTLYSIRLSDGHVNWTFPTGSQIIVAPIVGADGRIFVVSSAGTLYSLSPLGTVVWQRPLGTGSVAGPMSMGPDGTIYVGNTRGGMAIVRQQALELPPVSLSVQPGFLQSGGVPELAFSDNAYVRMAPGPVLAPSIPPIRAIVSTLTSFTNLASMRLSIESAANQNGIRQVAELYNFTLGQFEVMDVGMLSTTDQLTAFADSSNPNRFVHATTGEIRLRLSYNATQPLLQFPWTVRADLVRFSLVPHFEQ